jgi:hypothetical protein
MQAKLARTFIERKIIQRGTVFEAHYSTKGISGQFDTSVVGSFRLVGAKSVGEWVYFDTIGPEDARFTIRCDSVVSLDGMPLQRIAESHQLTIDGDDIVSNSRRGRRRKPEEEMS